MKRIHFAVDGPRDGATLPHIVANVLKIEVEPVIYEWKNIRLNQGKGYPGKLSYALRQAKAADADGLVAVVDRDKDEKRARLKKLQVAREADREKNSAFPIALGEADPHGEAWLLDASHAIRKALELTPEVSIPTVTETKYPKDALNVLIDGSKYHRDDWKDILADIAKAIDPARCENHEKTGFKEWIDEVRFEFGRLTGS